MTALPSVAEAAIAAGLVLSVARAFFGPAPRSADFVAAAAWMSAGLLMLATVILTGDEGLWRLALNVGAVEAVCVAGWWLRGADDDGGEPVRADGDPPIDWDEFDRERDGWSRPPLPLGPGRS
jgi:hypothetical protein